MTPQEIFDKVAKHLLHQKVKSYYNQNGTCAYRGSNGTMCAVGCLITDEEYSPDMEGKTVGGLLSWARYRAIERPMFYTEKERTLYKGLYERLASHQGLLIELQEIHDGGSPEYWHNRLSELALRHDLKMPEGIDNGNQEANKPNQF